MVSQQKPEHSTCVTGDTGTQYKCDTEDYMCVISERKPLKYMCQSRYQRTLSVPKQITENPVNVSQKIPQHNPRLSLHIQ